MPPVKFGSASAAGRWNASVALLSLSFVLLFARPGLTQPEPLTFFKNYFITGDYVVGGASLWQKGGDGPARVQIAMPEVPDGADILAAFLYVQTAEAVQWSGIDHAKFNGADLGPGSSSAAKALNWDLATTPCWSVALPGGRRLVTYRADVLRYLPIGPNGKQHAAGPHDLEVPDSGPAFGDVEEGGSESGGGTGPRAVGASLVVVYRDPTKPFKAIVIYDGGFKKAAFATMDQTISGFYEASTIPGAKMTHIVGDGRPFVSERVLLNGELIATNPFVSAEGPKWDNPTFDNLPLPAGAASAAVRVAPNGLLSDCLCYSGIVFSTEVQDSDGDGLLDVWESSDAPILDPLGAPLPSLKSMGADPLRKDLFIEVGYMKTDAPTSYGGAIKPAHSHLPGPAALKLMGDAFAKEGIAVHFDVGSGYSAGEALDYVIPAALARGGEAIDESATVCTRGASDPPWVCQFSDYPGTIGWKSGFRFLRDEVFSVTPPPPVTNPPTPLEDYCGIPGYTCNMRFDRNRKDMFRYALFAHALGLPKSEDPADPGFHVPRTNTGVGDFPGGDVMVTLGAFADIDGAPVDDDGNPATADVWTAFPVGTPFMQASTLMHELGHNMERRHGGEAFEPNCKPTYLSVMNYLYQLRGLLDDSGKPHLDFSGSTSGGINESTLSDGPWGGLRYRIGWYAPLTGSYLDPLLGGRGTAALRHCDGSDVLPTDVPMVRIDARTAAGQIDWNANGVPTDSAFSLDVNFNGRIDASLNDSNDWSGILLNQIGARRNTGGVFADPEGYLFVGPLSLDSGRGDLGRGDLGRGDLGRGDLGRGDLGRGDLGRGDLGRGDLGSPGRGDLGRGDLGRGDLGGGDLFVGDPDNPGGELDFETATDLAKTPPNEFTACVIGVTCEAPPATRGVLAGWKAPNIGGASGYSLYRVPGSALAPGQAWETVEGEITGPDGQGRYSLVDGSAGYGQEYTYFAVATYADGTQSDPSNLVTITTPKASSIVTVSCPSSVSYTGSPQTPCTAEATGPATGPVDVTASLIYTNNTEAGDATASASWGGDASHFGSSGSGGFTIAKAAPAFSGLSGPSILSGATPTALGGTLKAGASVPPGSVSITLNGVTQAAAIDPATGAFSSSFATGALTPTSSPYTITYSYAGDANFTAAGPDTSKSLTVNIVYTLVGIKNVPPPTGTKFNAGSSVTMEWQFRQGSTPVDSSQVVHRVTVTGAGMSLVFLNTDPGGSGFRYTSSSKTWQFNLQTKSASGQKFPAGVYTVTIAPQAAGYASKTFQIVLK